MRDSTEFVESLKGICKKKDRTADVLYLYRKNGKNENLLMKLKQDTKKRDPFYAYNVCNILLS